ncbi:MAG: hypothetical protein H6779_03585 [Candidatus Nomurabacteria bacterium]|nr:hypothetical protein [Candidatus Nomurabacteria bacterium]USN87469.1 MAG: hypothetical protein H6779_03585 [Candidatus Nomurabacteria bacterium]
MDRNEKFLKKLSNKELSDLSDILELIKEGKTKQVDVKKLVGYSDVFRVRKEKIRIIFLANRDRIDILEISRRNDKTYKNF